jgi:hypothetical protein
MNSGPQQASTGQVLGSTAVMAGSLAVPVICWYTIPHKPLWGFIAAMAVASFAALMIGGFILSFILAVPRTEDEAEYDIPHQPGPSDPVYAIAVAYRHGRRCQNRGPHPEHRHFWKAVDAPVSGSTWCRGWPR